VLQMDTRFEHVSGKYRPTLMALFPETPRDARPAELRGSSREPRRRRIKGFKAVLMPTALLRKLRRDRGECSESSAQNTHFCDYFWNPVFVTI